MEFFKYLTFFYVLRPQNKKLHCLRHSSCNNRNGWRWIGRWFTQFLVSKLFLWDAFWCGYGGEGVWFSVEVLSWLCQVCSDDLKLDHLFFFSSDNHNKNKNAQKFDAPSTKLQPPSQKTTSNHLPNANSYIPVQKQGDSRSGTNNTAIIIIKQWHQKRLNITHYSKIQPFIHQFSWTPSIQILHVWSRPRPKIRIWFYA